MDAFEALFHNTNIPTRGTVRQKMADGTVRTGKLKVAPKALTPQAAGEAAMAGATFSERLPDGSISRGTDGAITGAAARSAALAILGFKPATGKTATESRAKGSLPVPSLNADAPADGVK